MKCLKCGSEIDDEIEIDGWNSCPLCGIPMLGFSDDVLDLAADMLLRDMVKIEKRMQFLSKRLRANKIENDQ